MTPYIPKERRDELGHEYAPASGGELNFLIAKTIDHYVRLHGLSYKTIEEILAAVEGAKSEFYLTVARTYEERKRERNGEVFTACVRALEGEDG